MTDLKGHKETEQAQDQFFDLSFDILCIASMEGYFTCINPACTQTLGYPANALLDQPFLALVYHEDCELTRQALDILKEGQPVTDFVNRMICQDGSLRWIHWRGVPNSARTLVFFVARDMTELKAQEKNRRILEAQVCHSQKMQAMGTLAGGIAHDFNNILSAILGYSELALRGVDEGSPVHRQIKEVCLAGSRAKGLVAQILDFSRQRDPERQPIEFQVLLDETIRFLKATLPSTIMIRQCSRVTNNMILADSTQIHQVILNLCTNACQAMGEDGGNLELLLEAFKVGTDAGSFPPALSSGEYLRLTVRDSGSGMSSEVLERAFDPFFTTKNSGEGTGMGLAVVHGIIANHQGAIIIDSQLGIGTTAQVYLPVLSGSQAPGVDIHTSIPKGQECILFVDDEETLCRLNQELLECLGYEVVAKTNSVEALEAFRQTPARFDLVMTDYTMPTMTGKVLVKEIRKIRSTVPVIVCSGFSDCLPEEAIITLNIQGCLCKPIEHRELAITIRRVLDQSSKVEAYP